MSAERSAATVYDRASALVDVIETEVYTIHCHPQITDQALAAIVAAKQELKLALADAGVEERRLPSSSLDGSGPMPNRSPDSSAARNGAGGMTAAYDSEIRGDGHGSGAGPKARGTGRPRTAREFSRPPSPMLPLRITSASPIES